MSEKLTSEQIAAITKLVEQQVNQNVSTQQLIPVDLGILNQIPGLITNLITGPAGAAVGLVNSLINNSLGALTGITNTLAGSNLAPQLVNIIKEQVPAAQQAQAQQQKQN